LLVGQKKPLEPKHVWSIRVRLELAGSKRDLALFNLAIDSKLRACDLDPRVTAAAENSEARFGIIGASQSPALKPIAYGTVQGNVQPPSRSEAS
jgi:hypothetical protein